MARAGLATIPGAGSRNTKFLEAVRHAIHAVEITGARSLRIEATNAMFLIGNGGSATIAEHIAVDAIKMGYNARALTNSAVMSMLANDYGWKEVFAMHFSTSLGANDWLIAISSSGRSENICHAAIIARRNYNARIMTLSGFEPDNPLRELGDVNYYVPSKNYGVVEITHLAILHSIVNPGI